MRVLVVDDDPKILAVLRRGLILEGYDVDMAEDGEQALALVRENLPDMVILDIMLPGIDGLEVCRRLRRLLQAPILMLTAKDTVPDRIAGLDSGADDYMVKPYSFDELLARLRAMRRRIQAEEHQLRFADLIIHPPNRQVERGGERLELTTQEYDLLEFFLRHPLQVLTRQLILESVWDYQWHGGSNVVDVHIHHLRHKLEAGGRSRLIQTMRGVGYSLREE